jgi:vacuolar-type H+-ATPase subunit H
MATETSGATVSGSVEALKRVKTTEAECDARLNAARQVTDVKLRQLREEAETAVKAAQAEADRERTERVERARVETAALAEAIVADGRKAAVTAARGEGRRPADKKDAILDAVLGSFGKD